MKFVKLSLVAALLAGSSLLAEEKKSDLSISANMALTSNYVWRGMTQSNNGAATQAGLDLEYKGIYLGTWGSSTNFGAPGVEADLYAGYAGEIAGIGFDIGAIQFIYPEDMDNLNFAEVYAGLSYTVAGVEVGATYYYGATNDAPSAVEGSASTELSDKIAADVTVGKYTDYGTYYSAALSTSMDKYDLSVAFTGIIYEDDTAVDENNIVGTISTTF